MKHDMDIMELVATEITYMLICLHHCSQKIEIPLLPQTTL
jgi:hypothetical protein